METDMRAEQSGEDNTEPASGAISDHPDATSAVPVVGRSWRRAAWWIDAAILGLAAFLRLAWLDVKPPHFDEGVNGWFVDSITHTGVFQYDPSNFHGPLHFYILFVAQTLLGRAPWVLRLPLALASLGAVWLALRGYRRFFPTAVCRWAALAMAISPGMAFFGRYAIHESWLVLFQMITFWGILRLWQDGSRRGLWAVGMGLAGMILTKETWIIHGIALALAAPVLWLWERLSPSATQPIAAQKWTATDLGNVAAASLGLIIFFYSACLLDPPSLRGIFDAYAIWKDTGMTSASGHEKPWSYWFELMSIYEWPALVGLAASAGLIWPDADRRSRFLALASIGAFVGYCIVSYKTPWCLISMIWPFFLFFGQAVDWTRHRVDRWTFGVGAALICTFSLSASVDLNFRHYAGSDDQPDYAEPYVYVQTRRDIELLLEPLEWLKARDPMALHRPAHVIQPEQHPLRWLLGDYTHITWDDAEGNPEPMDATWLLVDESAVDRIEDALQHDYFKTSLRLRGMAPDMQMLYLRADTFRDYFTGREPEFVSAEGELSRELEEAK